MKLLPFLLIASVFLPACAASSNVQEHDGVTLIRGAIVVDGTGAPGRRADVRIKGDRIVEVGSLRATATDRIAEGSGLVLAPGFIDTHSHHVPGLAKQREALPMVSQGVTTVVGGQDGLSPSDVGAFFDDLEASPSAVNVATYVGHNAIRDLVMGKDFKRPASPAEQAEMVRIVDKAMEDGALGLSTGLEYDPGINSTTEEVITLAKAAARHGGRYITHMRSEDRDIWNALDEVVAIGRATGMPVQVSHMKLAMTDLWGQADRFIAVMDKARTTGVNLTGDVYPYEFWQSTLIVLWPERDIDNPVTAAFVLKSLAPPEGIRFTQFPGKPDYIGKTLAEIAAARGSDPVETVIALFKEAGDQYGAIRIIGTSMAPQDVSSLIAWPHSNISSDGAIGDLHPRGAGSFAKVLRKYVREDRLLTIEQAIHKMSGLAAEHMGLVDRGVIRPGAYADLVLFDPATITDHATIAQPQAMATGVKTVWVNGEPVFRDGKATGLYAGRPLRRR